MVRAPRNDKGARFSAGLFGLWLGLGLLKFGNPPIFAEQIATPASLLQFILDPWPLTWAYVLSGIVFALTIGKWRWSATSPKWIVALPAAWFLWQLVAALRSVDPSLTAQTLPHFLCVSGAFYFGFAVLANLRDLRLFWIFFLGSVVLVVMVGCHQHFIGLEETRRYFIAYELPKYPNGPPPELVKKLASNRIYSTLFYPNTLAAALILGMPLLVTKIYSFPYATRSARVFLVAALGLAGLFCLFWSGSKAGWLIALLMAVLALFRLEFSRRIKVLLLIVICLAGTSGFVWRYSLYLKRGATSATARLDYWRAAVRGFREHSFLGSGPGTFMLTYKRLKPPQAEMARLAHNDYLQQASDSGFPGFATFTVFIISSLALLYRKALRDVTRFAVWLSLFGLSVHGFFDFNLYVPALAWSQFLFFGWLWGTHKNDTSTYPQSQTEH